MNREATEQEFALLAELIEGRSGIVLPKNKKYLIEGRLGPLLEALDCVDYAQLHREAVEDRSGMTSNLIIDAICTTETSFFRDGHPFRLLEGKILPELTARAREEGQGHLRLFSAGCSSGQEAYSIAMLLDECMQKCPRCCAEIVAADISNVVISRAEQGLYTKHELSRGLSPNQIGRNFRPDGSRWRIRERVRSLVQFRKVNLLQSLVTLGPFDIVFCRNVAIYFSRENREKLFCSLADRLPPGGILMIGSTESLSGISECFVRKKFEDIVYYEKV